MSDTGANLLLLFLSNFLLVLSRVLKSGALKDYSMELPRSVAMGRKILGTDIDKFTRWACCPTCSSIYPVDECREKLINGQLTSKKCTFVRFLHHPQVWRRKECGKLLMKNVKTSAGTIVLTPLQTYCYKSITQSLKELLQRSDFVGLCEKWRNRTIEQDVLQDIYDGSVWKEFMDIEGVPFLSTPLILP